MKSYLLLKLAPIHPALHLTKGTVIARQSSNIFCPILGNKLHHSLCVNPGHSSQLHRTCNQWFQKTLPRNLRTMKYETFSECVKEKGQVNKVCDTKYPKVPGFVPSMTYFSLSGPRKTTLLEKNKHLNVHTSRQPISLSAKSIVDASPQHIKPYLHLCRFDKPIGTWLLYLPCTWSIALAAQPGHFPDLVTLGLFGLGAVLMRGAGCTINDMWDKDFDRKVVRTRARPLASGALNDFQALKFLGLQLSVSLAILLSFNWYSIFLGASSMLLVVTYPYMKRVTYWPQIFLGLTFNYGALLGWSVIRGACDWTICLPLYSAGILWTIVYDTIYAHQDKEDDIQIGVKSTALYMGEDTKTWLSCLSAGMVASLLCTGIMADQTWPYYLGVTITAAHLANQIQSVNLDSRESCWKAFQSNKNLGLILFAAIVAGNLLKSSKDSKVNDNVEETL